MVSDWSLSVPEVGRGPARGAERGGVWESRPRHHGYKDIHHPAGGGVQPCSNHGHASVPLPDSGPVARYRCATTRGHIRHPSPDGSRQPGHGD